MFILGYLKIIYLIIALAINQNFLYNLYCITYRRKKKIYKNKDLSKIYSNIVLLLFHSAYKMT